jgi:hypothetical protein
MKYTEIVPAAEAKKQPGTSAGLLLNLFIIRPALEQRHADGRR